MGVLRTLEASAAVERLRAVGGRAFVREVLGSASSSPFTSTSASTSPAPTFTFATDKNADKHTDADASTDILAKAAASERELARTREREREEARGAEGGEGGSSSSSLSDEDVLDGLDGYADAAVYEDGFGDEDGEQEGAEADVEKLLTTSAAAQAFRRTLGSSEVFEDAGAGLEEARDRVVDLLTGEV
ncbi:hypothetical protein B0H16DRAFT_1743071 [Mycena metata]|uniref:Uncharacterized protein n=1 Tax=Mycena metata TaxID=1033252 RepID=A0AAD7H760_9AGAR|nr:hypothetical protein B0H16DRAFT_1743071 [Mycena metata]